MANPHPSQPRPGAPGEAIEFHDAPESPVADDSAAPPPSQAEPAPDPNATSFPANADSGSGFEIDWADEESAVVPGDAILIPPRAIHTLRNTGSTDLKILCCCAPPYSHGDTVLVEVSDER